MLRRFLESIGGTSTSTLALELIVLIIGVFLGVQVDRWFEERQEAQEDRRYLERLREDMTQTASLLDAANVDIRELYDEATVTLRALERCALPEVGIAPILRTYGWHQVLPSLPVVRATYDEMLSAGAFARIDDGELKQAIAGLFSYVETQQDTINYLRTDLGRASELILGELAFTVDADGQLALEAFDLEASCRSTPIRSATAEIVDSRADWVQLGGLLEPMLERVIAMLDVELRS